MFFDVGDSCAGVSVVGMVADGMTREEILKAYPDLKAKDVEEALR